MAKPTTANVTRNALSGLLIGGFVGSEIAQSIAYGGWIKNAPMSPDIANGLIHGHNEHGSLVYLSAAQSVGINLTFLLIWFFFLGVAIGPKKNVKTRFASATWDADDPYRLQLIFAVLTTLVALAVAHFKGMEVLGWIAQSGIGVSNDKP